MASLPTDKVMEIKGDVDRNAISRQFHAWAWLDNLGEKYKNGCMGLNHRRIQYLAINLIAYPWS